MFYFDDCIYCLDCTFALLFLILVIEVFSHGLLICIPVALKYLISSQSFFYISKLWCLEELLAL